MSDKAIRAAKLTAAGLLDKARARTAVTRAGGQIAPSKYLPNVPRQVRADGGNVDGNDGIAAAEAVAKMLREGRAKEITNEHLDAADPQHLFKLYETGKTGMDLPMDHASRMERAEAMGFDTGNKLYHGTDRAFSAFDPKKFGEKDAGWYGRGVTTDTDPEVAEGYANYHEPEQGQNIIPTFSRGRHIDWPSANQPFGNPRESAQGTKDMQALGYSGSRMTNDRDLYGSTPDVGSEQVTFDPNNVRSRFARFDPRLAHLSHLNAATGGRIHANKGGKMGARADFIAGNHPEVPNVVYHSTKSDFHDFRPMSHFGTMQAAHDRYSPDQKLSEGMSVMPVHISLKNPLDVGLERDWQSNRDTVRQAADAMFKSGRLDQDYLKAAEKMYDLVDDKRWGSDPRAAEQSGADLLREAGHDGIIYHNTVEDPGSRSFVTLGPEQVKSSIGNQGTFDPTHPDMTKKDGGRIRANKGGKMNEHGLYSKAAQIIRSLAQERGTAEQMIAAAKTRGMKDAELQNFGPLPTGKISREDLARAFEARIPSVRVDQYGENPAYLSRQEQIERKAMRDNPHDIPMMPFEQRRLDELNARHGASAPVNVVNTTFEDSDGEEVTEPVDTLYSGYHTKGGTNYRERLLRLNQPDHPAIRLNQMIDHKQNQLKREIPAYGEDHPIVQEQQKRLQDLIADRDRALREHGPMREPRQRYQSSHWRDHPDVLAHIRMQDRMVGNKKMLHVEELQSDWAQEGRDKGFYNPEKPIEVFHTGTGETVHATDDLMEAKKKAEELGPQYDYAYQDHDKLPPAPYVQNTQHWTDLALKHVLREAALGGYDGIVFTPGQAQADRYSLDKYVDEVHYEPETKTFYANNGIGNPRRVIEKENVEPDQLHALVGKDVADKLLDPKNHYQYGNTIRSTVSDNDLKVSATGMKGYYDQIVPKSVTRLAQMHDPAAKPGQPVPFKGDDGSQEYQGFHLPMTDKMRQGILNEGFPAMKRGGAVDDVYDRIARADGGRLSLYSKAAKIVSGMKDQPMQAADIVKYALGKGAKKTEMAHVNVPPGKATPKQVADHIQSMQPQIGVQRRGEQDYSKLSPAGLTEYQRLARMPMENMDEGDVNLFFALSNEVKSNPTRYDQYQLPGGKNYREHILTLDNHPSDQTYMAKNHWGKLANPLAHIRMSDRMIGNKKILHIEELQSDWNNDARKRGFSTGTEKKDYEDYVAALRQKAIDNFDASEATPMIKRAMRDKFRSMDPYMLAMKMGVQAEHRDMYIKSQPDYMGVPRAPYINPDRDDASEVAMKHILTEAAKGGYDGIAFTPDEAQEERWPTTKFKGIYNKKLPGMAQTLVQQHDPETENDMTHLQGWAVPMIPLSEKARGSIMQNGFTSFKRGGAVDDALALTRRFTKDGKAATMALKPKGK